MLKWYRVGSPTDVRSLTWTGGSRQRLGRLTRLISWAREADFKGETPKGIAPCIMVLGRQDDGIPALILHTLQRARNHYFFVVVLDHLTILS
jgi:hypothetical protein